MAYRPRKRGAWMRLTSKDILRTFIEDRGLSYGQIADMVGCHRSMISQLVNGHRGTCTEELARRIERCLGVPRNVLFVSNPSAISSRNDKRRMKENAA